jgi:excisionase family DNA binding protein
MSDKPLFLTAKQVAAALQVDQSTIYRMMQRNEIPHIKVGGFSRRIPAKWLDEQIEQALRPPEIVSIDRTRKRNAR